MGVVAIWRYPVKAMLGELLDRADVGLGGLDGDRRWVVVDSDSGEPIASKRGRTDARLRACRAQLAGGELTVTLPQDGGVARGEAEAGDALSELLGRRVHLARHPGGGDRFTATGGHHDLAPLHLVCTRDLARLYALAPASTWDARRFRPNLVLDDRAVAAGAGDEQLLGRELCGTSGLELRAGLPTPRCVVTTRAQEELPADRAVLRTIAATTRWDLGPFGRPACFGFYAEVRRPGTVQVDETLALGPAAGDAGAVVDAAVARVARELG